MLLMSMRPRIVMLTRLGITKSDLSCMEGRNDDYLEMGGRLHHRSSIPKVGLVLRILRWILRITLSVINWCLRASSGAWSLGHQ